MALPSNIIGPPVEGDDCFGRSEETVPGPRSEAACVHAMAPGRESCARSAARGSPCVARSSVGACRSAAAPCRATTAGPAVGVVARGAAARDAPTWSVGERAHDAATIAASSMNFIEGEATGDQPCGEGRAAARRSHRGPRRRIGNLRRPLRCATPGAPRRSVDRARGGGAPSHAPGDPVPTAPRYASRARPPALCTRGRTRGARGSRGSRRSRRDSVAGHVERFLLNAALVVAARTMFGEVAATGVRR